MTRHVTDQNKGHSVSRIRRFAEVERRQGSEGAHPAVRAVVARPAAASGRRVVEFARIARGRLA